MGSSGIEDVVGGLDDVVGPFSNHGPCGRGIPFNDFFRGWMAGLEIDVGDLFGCNVPLFDDVDFFKSRREEAVEEASGDTNEGFVLL